MIEDLDAVTEEWFALLERQEGRLALDLFCTRILPAILPSIRACFVADHPRAGTGGRYDGVISLLGYTPDTSIIAARFTETERLVVLHTAETAQFLEDVRTYAGLPEALVTAVQFDRGRIDDLERAFHEARHLLFSSRIAVEVTGGTKPMSTILHVAAALADVDTLYIDYERYEPRYRKPVPASIHVRMLDSRLRSSADVDSAAALLGRLRVVHDLLRSTTTPGSMELPGAIRVKLDAVCRELTALEHDLDASRSGSMPAA